MCVMRLLRLLRYQKMSQRLPKRVMDSYDVDGEGTLDKLEI